MPRSTTEPTAEDAPEVAYIGLGANLGDPATTIRAACATVERLPLTAARARSALYRTAPIDAGGPDFVNAVVAVQTRLTPQALLVHLHAIEAAQGRERPYRNAPRCLDLDLLLHGDRCIDTPQLRLPHPRMAQRRFVLEPLAQIAPDLVIPGLGAVALLLERVRDQAVTRIDDA
jgi:2-amino-4-hydroxy-6-hydroxymethyldihydropteridine diphosphokinase